MNQIKEHLKKYYKKLFTVHSYHNFHHDKEQETRVNIFLLMDEHFTENRSKYKLQCNPQPHTFLIYAFQINCYSFSNYKVNQTQKKNTHTHT